MYQAGISLYSITSKSFEVAVDAISQFGPGTPSYHEIRGPLLSSASPVDVRENQTSNLLEPMTDDRAQALALPPHLLAVSQVGISFYICYVSG